MFCGGFWWRGEMSLTECSEEEWISMPNRKKKLNIIKFHIINIKWYEELKNNQRTSLKGVTLLIWK